MDHAIHLDLTGVNGSDTLKRSTMKSKAFLPFLKMQKSTEQLSTTGALPGPRRLLHSVSELNLLQTKKNAPPPLDLKKEDLQGNQETGYFGVPLSAILARDSEKGKIPSIVSEMINFLETRGIYTEGIFRICALQDNINSLIYRLNSGSFLFYFHCFLF